MDCYKKLLENCQDNIKKINLAALNNDTGAFITHVDILEELLDKLVSILTSGSVPGDEMEDCTYWLINSVYPFYNICVEIIDGE